jgi:hypothetical protein
MEEKPPAAPVMDVVTPAAVKAVPADAEPKDKPAPVETPKAKVQQKPAKPAKKRGNGVGMAIFATIVIVLGLAAMATYAYLKTK